MKTFNYTITDPLGIHARPAGMLVKSAKPFDCVNTITFGEKTVGLKLIAIMGLGIKQGDAITISCDGPDEDAASSAIEAVLKKNF